MTIPSHLFSDIIQPQPQGNSQFEANSPPQEIHLHPKWNIQELNLAQVSHSQLSQLLIILVDLYPPEDTDLLLLRTRKIN
jgi:hypothetical protein